MTRRFVAKAWLGGVGLGVGLVGMASGRRWLVWVAVGLIALAFSARFAAKER